MNHGRHATRYVRMLGLAALAVLAFGAVTASSASAALPEFKEAEFPVEFTSTSGEGLLETVAGRKIVCKKDENKGKVGGAKTVKEVVVTFKECVAEGFLSCGTITTKPLKGTLAYATEEPKVVGLVLTPETEGGLFAEFTCGGILKVKVRGHVIGHLTPINTLTETYTLTFSQTKGVQESGTQYEEEGVKKGCGEGVEGKECFLETKGEGFGGFEWEQAGEKTTDTIKGAQKLKVEA